MKKPEKPSLKKIQNEGKYLLIAEVAERAKLIAAVRQHAMAGDQENLSKVQKALVEIEKACSAKELDNLVSAINTKIIVENAEEQDANISEAEKHLEKMNKGGM